MKPTISAAEAWMRETAIQMPPRLTRRPDRFWSGFTWGLIASVLSCLIGAALCWEILA